MKSCISKSQSKQQTLKESQEMKRLTTPVVNYKKANKSRNPYLVFFEMNDDICILKYATAYESIHKSMRNIQSIQSITIHVLLAFTKIGQNIQIKQ